MSAAAEVRKHSPATPEAVASSPPSGPANALWASILDKVHTHQKDREDLYRLLAR